MRKHVLIKSNLLNFASIVSLSTVVECNQEGILANLTLEEFAKLYNRGLVKNNSFTSNSIHDVINYRSTLEKRCKREDITNYSLILEAGLYI